MFKTIRRVYNLMSGSFDIASEKLLTMSESSIRSIFRMAKNKLVKTHQILRENLINILTLLEERQEKLTSMKKELDEVVIKKKGAEEKIKTTKDEKYNLILNNLVNKESSLKDSIKIHEEFLLKNEGITSKYTSYILKIQNKIDEIEFAEEQTISDIELAKSTSIIKDIAKSKIDINYSTNDISIIERARKRAVMAMRVDEYQDDIEQELYEEGLKIK